MLPVVSAVAVLTTFLEVIIGFGVAYLLAQRFPDNPFAEAFSGIFGGN